MKIKIGFAVTALAFQLAACAPTHEAGAVYGANTAGGRAASFVEPSFKASAKTKPQPFGYCDNGVDCGIELEEAIVDGHCALIPSAVDRVVVVRGRGNGREVKISWYIPPPLQGRYRFEADDGVSFSSKDAKQAEFDQEMRVSPAEFRVRDRMTDRTRGFGYKIQATRSDGVKCFVDPIVVNDW